MSIKIVPIEKRQPTLEEDIADFKRVEAEQRARKERITQGGREHAKSQGRLLMPSFSQILQEHSK